MVCGTAGPICEIVAEDTTVFDLSGGVGGFNSPLVDDDPLTDCKSLVSSRIRPAQKGQKSKFVVKSL